MSVHTHLTQETLDTLFSAYQLGPLVNVQGITAGVTNTIYKLSTSEQHYVFTLFEELTPTQLPFYLELMNYLAQHHYPCPTVIADKNNNYIQLVAAKPAVLMTYLPGAEISLPTATQCANVGHLLAQLHRLGMKFPLQQNDTRGDEWRRSRAQALYAVMPTQMTKLLQAEMKFQTQQDYSSLRQGIIHADLFTDNILFQQDTISAVLDFYYACNGYFLYDLAITVNAWCMDATQHLRQDCYAALIAAYQQTFPIPAFEKTQWQAQLRLAALRFWLSRLYDAHFVKRNALVQIKDPSVYQRILYLHQTQVLCLD